VKIRRSEIGSKGRDLLALAVRLRKLDARYVELRAEQRSLLRDRNQEAARRDAARALLVARRQIGWARDDIPKIDVGDAADALEVVRCAEITIRVLNKILAETRQNLAHVEVIRRGLRLLVKKP
jgi:hypothetical protein